MLRPRRIITSLYKGGGKDPLETNSYRGINQTAYQKKISCAEAIVSTLEIVFDLCKSGDCMYMCFYDLQRAFDSVQYSILLKRLYEAGINGKTWRLIRNWYINPKCMVRIDGCLSSTFTIQRGVLQGSVLSPILFLLVMDPLLRGLEVNKLGPSLHNVYVGQWFYSEFIKV